MSIRRSNQLSYTPEKGTVNKAGRSSAGKPSMNIPEVGGQAGPPELADNLAQALRGKGGIAEFGQREPLETDLPAVLAPPLPDRGEIAALTMEDRLDLMEVPMDAVHRVVLADVFAHIDQAAWGNLQTEFFPDLAPNGVR